MGITVFPKTFSTLLITCLLLPASLARAADPQPFVCSAGAFVVQDVDATLFEGDFDPICPNLGMEFNNIGFHDEEGMIYAIKLTPTGNEGIVRIDADCTVDPLGSPPGLPTDERFDAGELSPDNSTFYIHTGGTDRLYVVTLEPVPAVATVASFAATGNVHDWAFDPASDVSAPVLYGVTTDGFVSRLEIATGTRTDSLLSVLPAGVAYGGARFDGAGRLVAYRNSGEIFVVDVTDINNPGIVSDGFGRASTRNDAVSCQVELCNEAYSMQDSAAVLFQTSSSNLGIDSPVAICSHEDDPSLTGNTWKRAPSANPPPPVPNDVEFNNMCFDREERRIYALELHPGGNNGLVRIDPETCIVEPLGPVAGLPATERFDAGDCWDKKLLVNVGGVQTKFYVVDLVSVTAEPVDVQKAHPAANIGGFVHDWAFNPTDGKFYGGDNTQGQLATLRLEHDGTGWTGFREDRNMSEGDQLPSGDAFGGAWFDAHGHVVLHRNKTTGMRFEVDVIQRKIVATEGSSLSSALNDGASCVQPGRCLENEDCRVGEFCAKPLGACGGPGECVPRFEPIFCPAVVVCGCDGNVYPDPCAAREAGVSVDDWDKCF